MTYIVHETYGYNFKGFKFFWINRVLRLYPIYFAILICTILVLFIFPQVIRHKDLFMPKSISQWLANVSMVYPKVIPHNFDPRLSPPSWALTNELIFYLFISLGISKTKLRTLGWMALSILYFVGTYIYYDIPTYRYSAIFSSSLPFAIGACLYWFKDVFPKGNRWGLICILYILFILNAVYSTDSSPNYLKSLLFTLITSLQL